MNTFTRIEGDTAAMREFADRKDELTQDITATHAAATAHIEGINRKDALVSEIRSVDASAADRITGDRKLSELRAIYVDTVVSQDPASKELARLERGADLDRNVIRRLNKIMEDAESSAAAFAEKAAQGPHELAYHMSWNAENFQVEAEAARQASAIGQAVADGKDLRTVIKIMIPELLRAAVRLARYLRNGTGGSRVVNEAGAAEVLLDILKWSYGLDETGVTVVDIGHL